MFARVNQVLAGFAEGDAISSEAMALQDILRRWGVESTIYVDPRHVSPKVAGRWQPLEAMTCGPEDVLIHHYSIASRAVDAFAASPARKVLMYHNITPADYFRGYDDGVAAQLEGARRDLKGMFSRVQAVWAVSEFNARELRELGAPHVRVFPLIFSVALLDLPPDPEVFVKFAVKLTTIMFVGRIAPNKRIEDLIMAFAWYHRVINRQSRLLIIGSERSAPRYYLMLRMLANELDLPNVCFERFAAPEGLSGYYSFADLLVSPSDHEGYCLPLVEAMHRNVPVLAHRRGGMPEALDGAGVMYEDLSPAELAELMHLMLTDPALRAEVLTSQQARMQRLRARRVEDELRLHLDALGSGC